MRKRTQDSIEIRMHQLMSLLRAIARWPIVASTNENLLDNKEFWPREVVLLVSIDDIVFQMNCYTYCIESIIIAPMQLQNCRNPKDVFIERTRRTKSSQNRKTDTRYAAKSSDDAFVNRFSGLTCSAYCRNRSEASCITPSSLPEVSGTSKPVAASLTEMSR